MRLLGRLLSLAALGLVLALAACDSGGTDAPPRDPEPEDPGPGPEEPGPEEPGEACYSDAAVAGRVVTFGAALTSSGCYPAGALNELVGVGQVSVRVDALSDGPSCGTCLELAGPAGAQVVRMIEDCSDCPGEDEFDVDAGTFLALTGTEWGRADVSARAVPCPVDGGLRFFSTDATNDWFVQLYVTDHRHPLERVELWVAGAYVPLERRRYGAWEWMTSGETVEPPYAVRVTDAFGHVVETTVAVEPGSAVTVSEQLPACG